jgi:hypothetical protein
MQPVLRSITTSLIVPISSPWDDFTFVPTQFADLNVGALGLSQARNNRRTQNGGYCFE